MRVTIGDCAPRRKLFLSPLPALGHIRVRHEDPGGDGSCEAAYDAAGTVPVPAPGDLRLRFLEFLIQALDHAAQHLVILFELGVIVGIAESGHL